MLLSLKEVVYILRLFEGLQPLKGIGVLSKIDKNLIPAKFKPFKLEYLLYPNPLILTYR
jgi:hypothetical protein